MILEDYIKLVEKSVNGKYLLTEQEQREFVRLYNEAGYRKINYLGISCVKRAYYNIINGGTKK
mgnify:CR=1 FL=1